MWRDQKIAVGRDAQFVASLEQLLIEWHHEKVKHRSALAVAKSIWGALDIEQSTEGNGDHNSY